MRSNALVAAFAASVFAAPFAEPQDIISATVSTDSLAATVAGTSALALTVGASAAVSSSTPTTSVKVSTLKVSSTKASSTSSSKTSKSSTSTKKSTSSTSKKTSSSTSAKKTTSTTQPSTTVAATVSASLIGTPVMQSRTGTLPAGSIPTTLPQIAVYHHNIHRANHSAPDLVWSDSLAMIAGNIASSCVYAHNTAAGGGGYGQNIAAGVKADNISRVITDLFYNGEVGYYNGLYGDATPDFTNFVHWGHFSQVVWKQTSTVGCAVQYCPGGLANTGSNIPPYFTVCNYGPPGNYIGEFGDNVGTSMGLASAGWSTGLDITA